MASVKKSNNTNVETATVATNPTKKKEEEFFYWKKFDEQSMVLNLPTGCVVMFDGNGMQFVPNVRYVDGKFQ